MSPALAYLGVINVKSLRSTMKDKAFSRKVEKLAGWDVIFFILSLEKALKEMDK